MCYNLLSNPLDQLVPGKVVPTARERFSRQLVPDRASCLLSGEREKVEKGSEERREGRRREEGKREGSREKDHSCTHLHTCTHAGCM